MRRFRFSIKSAVNGVVALACLCVLPSALATNITYEMVTVGNPGNANDTGGYLRGAVEYSYQIGKYDVTIGQYAAFLNAVATTDTYRLYNRKMGTDASVMGIQQNGTSGSFTYSVIGSPNRPITYVSWFDAARFANWMSNGQGTGSTEEGAYTLNGAGITPGVWQHSVALNPSARFYLPTINEWYKASYYSPTRSGGTGGYYSYSTQSDVAPGNVVGGDANQANYYTSAGYSVTQSTVGDTTQNYLTDVGAFSGSASYYGTFDQTGNVVQWLSVDEEDADVIFDLYNYGVAFAAGTDWQSDRFYGVSSEDVYWTYDSKYESSDMGFRLAGPEASSVPEIDPSSFGSALAVVMVMMGVLERRRSR